MDGSRFDCVLRSLATGTPRRTVLKGLVGGSLAAALGLRAPDASARACRERQRRCRNVDQCCGGKAACQRTTKLTCSLSGKRCCGKEGAMCSVEADGCDCCDNLLCNPIPGGGGTRCSLPI